MIWKIKARDGMVFTNGEVFSDVGGIVVLSVNDSPDNWNEIIAEEAEKRQAEINNDHEVM